MRIQPIGQGFKGACLIKRINENFICIQGQAPMPVGRI